MAQYLIYRNEELEYRTEANNESEVMKKLYDIFGSDNISFDIEQSDAWCDAPFIEEHHLYKPGYAVVHAGSSVYGVGNTREEAIKQALEYCEFDEKELKKIIWQPEWNNACTNSDMVIIPCSRELINYVNKNGGDVFYDVGDGFMTLDLD